MSETSFSIVIPARNGERFLCAAISSAAAQSRKADEIIVVDDASTDKTAEIAQSGEWRGEVVYFFNEHSTGFVDAWNRAAAKASGDFITILHQDDLLHPDYLMHIEKTVKRYPRVRHFYSSCNYIDDKGYILKEPPLPYSLEPLVYSGRAYARRYLNGVVANNHIHRCPGVTTQRKLLLTECPYRKEAGHIADDDFFLRVGAFTEVVGISQPLASFRHHEGSETGSVELLSLKLAEAYLFQSEYYSGSSSLLEEDDVKKINNLAVRFINLLLFQSLYLRKKELAEKAVDLRDKFDRINPGYMKQTLPFWARPMWRMIARGRAATSSAYIYAASLHTGIMLRDRVSVILKKR